MTLLLCLRIDTTVNFGKTVRVVPDVIGFRYIDGQRINSGFLAIPLAQMQLPEDTPMHEAETVARKWIINRFGQAANTSQVVNSGFINLWGTVTWSKFKL